MITKSFRYKMAALALVCFALVASVSAQDAPTTESPAKKVGIIMPKTELTGADNTQAAAGLRSLIAQYFEGSNIEMVEIEALLPKAAAAEAKEKGCDYILQVAVKQKKGGGGFGMFKAIAPVVSSVIPMAGMAGVAGGIAGSVASTAISTAAMSGNTKAQDKFTFEYRLISTADNSVKSTQTLKAKASSDGEDVISPLVEKMAEAIVAAAK